MNSGRYVFSQVAEFIPKYEFEKIVAKYNGDYRFRGFTSYTHLLHLMFGQLTPCGSLRDICLCLKVHRKNLYHLGIGKTVDVSSFSRANERRDYRIFEELGYKLIELTRPLYDKGKLPYVYNQEYDILAVDSTTISCSIKLMTWALGKYSKGGVKMHTILDLRGSIPVYVWVTDSRTHDSRFLDEFEPLPNTFYVMDKAYLDFKALCRIDAGNAFFVTRAKKTMRYEVVSTNFNIDENTGLRADLTVRLTGYKSQQLYPKNLRLVRFYDELNDETLEFITNSWEITALETANIYRNRWQIESFFKWIKQNLTVKTLWGHSENAVKILLWAAICTFLVVATIKARYKSPFTVTEVATLLGVSALEKEDLSNLLVPSEPSESNQNVNELTLF